MAIRVCVLEALIQKSENEQNLHHRVELFFLADSITQCSHSQRGIAGTSYVSPVQAALSRLIGAAAPAGAGAQENRHQCHKVQVIMICLLGFHHDILPKLNDLLMIRSEKWKLSGLLSANVFEEDEEYGDNLPTNLCKRIDDTLPSELTPTRGRDTENQSVTEIHCILEDFYSELEMEDLSGHYVCVMKKIISPVGRSNKDSEHGAMLKKVHDHIPSS